MKVNATVNIKLVTLKRYFINLLKSTQDGDGCALLKDVKLSTSAGTLTRVKLVDGNVWM